MATSIGIRQELASPLRGLASGGAGSAGCAMNTGKGEQELMGAEGGCWAAANAFQKLGHYHELGLFEGESSGRHCLRPLPWWGLQPGSLRIQASSAAR